MTGFVIRPLNAAGHVTARPMPPLRRPDYSFVYLISGEVLTDIGGHSYLLRGRDKFYESVWEFMSKIRHIISIE